MTNNYYDRYWQREISGESHTTPPSWTKDNLDWHYDFFNNYIGQKVLDIGAGDGTFSNFLNSKNKTISVDALEVSENAIKLGQEKYRSVNFIKSDIENINTSTVSYNTVFAIEVLEHILDLDNTLENINKIIQKDGYLCITTTDFNLLKKILISIFYWEKYFYPSNPHIRFFTKNSLIDICKKHGFSLVKHKWNKSYFGLMPKGQMIVFQKI